MSLRINGLDTHYMYRDMVDVVEQAGDRLDAILVPKVGSAGDVHLVATLLDQVEAAVGLERRLGMWVLIETAKGMVNVDEIARACPERMEAMVFGVADYAASLQSHTASIGGVDPNYAVLTDGRPARASGTGATSGTTRSRASPSPAARTGCGRSTGRSGTSPTPTASSPPRAARPCSATRASGRSIPRRSSWRTRSSRPTSASPRARGGSWTRWRGRRRGARRRLARRPPDRRGLDPHGGEPVGEGDADRRARGRAAGAGGGGMTPSLAPAPRRARRDRRVV